MLRIPYELVRLIFEHLAGDIDKPSLCAVSLCSSYFHQESQPILFRDVTTLSKIKAHRKFLRTITTSPHRLALFVRAYKIFIGRVQWDISVVLHNGLKLMTNLKSLSVSLGLFAFTNPEGPAAMLRGCAFKLERFEWTSYSLELDTLLETFLPRQDGLKHLSMEFTNSTSGDRARPITSVEATICPRLLSLQAPWDVIKVFLPDRNIATLVVTVGPELDLGQSASDLDMSSLVPALQCIRALSYPLKLEDPQEVDFMLLQHCTSLTVLELQVHENMPENFLSVLSKVPALHTLIISQDQWFKGIVEPDRHVIRDIFHAYNVNVQCIDVQTGGETYARYKRFWGATTSIRVSASEVKKSWLSC